MWIRKTQTRCQSPPQGTAAWRLVAPSKELIMPLIFNLYKARHVHLELDL